MKFTVKKSSFETVLTHLQAFLDKKDSSQITSHIFIQTNDDQIILKATDYEIGLETKIDIKKELDGSATVNGKKILEIIKRLKDDDLILETDSQTVYIKQGKSKFKLPMFDSSEFPQTIYNTDQKINIDTKNFIHYLKKISPAIDSNNQKAALTGALLELKDYHLNFVATDIRRLAYVRENIQSIESFSVIIPKKALNEIIKLFDKDMEIYYSNTQLMIKNEYYTFFTRLINDKFPDYEKIIPKEFKFVISLPKNQVIDSIKLTNSLSPKVKITFRNNEILFESMTTESSEQAQTQFEYNINIQEEISIGVDSRYLLDFLSQVESEKFEICIKETNVPFLVRDDKKFATIILPII